MKNFGTTLWKELRLQLPNPVASVIIIHEIGMNPMILPRRRRRVTRTQFEFVQSYYNVYNTTIVVVAVHFCAILGNLYYSVAE